MSSGTDISYTITALVPIKGESTRVAGKNVRDFCGKPLAYRVLEMLQASACISRIVVNTDSDLVATLASAFSKVSIHERPAALRGHDIAMNAIIEHDLRLLGGGHYLQTHVTNPMLTGKTTQDAVNRYFSNIRCYDSLFSVIHHQSRFFDARQRAINHDPAALINTQDLPPVYEENSCLYIFSDASFFANKKNRIGKKPALYPMNKLESLDIDTEDEFALAESAWRAFRRS